MSALPCAHVTFTRLVVRPSDMDADRNVSNAIYFEYFFQARLEHLIRLGVYHPRRDPCSGNVFALAENNCRYLAPSYYGDILHIWTATCAVGRSSFQLGYRAWREGDDVLVAAGHSAQVWLGETNRSTPLPETVHTALTGSLCADLPELPPHG